MSLFKDEVEIKIMEGELQAKNTFQSQPRIFRWVIIFFICSIIPAYYIAKFTSKKIWLSRYSQNAVSAKASFTNPLPIKKSDVTLTSSGNNTYAAAIKITNPNLSLSLDQVTYQFNFYNSQKQQIYTYPDKLFLLPNQSKYVTVPTFNMTDKIAYADFQMPSEEKVPWQKRLEIPQVQLLTSIPNTDNQSSPQAFVVQGDFTNNSPYNLNKVRLTFIIYDKSDKIINISQRDEFNLTAYERRAYNQTWPNTTINNLGRVEVSADTDVLDPNNISVVTDATSSASDLSR